jgi:hypothetical protein
MGWQLVIVAVFAATLVLVLLEQRHLRDLPTLFLALAIWGRFFVAFMHEYSLQPIVAGLSGIALYTFLVMCIGLTIIPPRYLFYRHLFPYYALFLCVVLSGFVNAEWAGIVADLSRWAFFVVIALLALRAFQTVGIPKVVRLLLIVFLPPLILQMLGAVVGIKSYGPDGAPTYIGGYFIDSSFWKILFGLICVSALLRTRYDVVPMLAAIVSLFGIFLTNHRTALMGTLPVIGMMGISVLGHLKAPALRVVLVLAMGVGVLAATPFAFDAVSERYRAIGEFALNLDKAFADPMTLSESERRLGSGRIGDWSTLLYAWRDGDAVTHLLGFGPETVPVQPHNEYVGFLFQFGVIGLALFVVILAWQVVLTFQVKDRILGLRLLACTIGFIVVCFTTNQVWAIEGLLTLAIINAVTWAALPENAAVRTPERAAAAAPPRKIGARWAKSPVRQRDRTA